MGDIIKSGPFSFILVQNETTHQVSQISVGNFDPGSQEDKMLLDGETHMIWWSMVISKQVNG